jgi:hypothetical protein
MQGDEAAEHQAAHDAAAHMAAQLHHLGWQEGAGAAVWARAVTDEMERHEAARHDFGQRQDREAWERMHSTALMLVVAIDQVLSFERRIRKLTGDAELAEARKNFDAAGPRAEALRDLIAHLDEYATGTGRRQTGQAQPPITDPYVTTFMYWSDGGGTIVDLGDEQLNLRVAAAAAKRLAEVVERARERGLQRAEQQANAALRLRWGIDR